MSNRFVVAAAVVVATAAFAGRAQAQITHQYMTSGHACSPAKADVGKISYNTQFGIFNDDSANQATVYCPVNWDTILEQQDPSVTFLNFEIDVADFSTTANVSCKVVSTDINGAIVQSQTKTSLGSSGNQVLIFLVSTSRQIASLGFSCTLPPKVSAGSNRVLRYSLFDGPSQI
jgi:hypothetical protein